MLNNIKLLLIRILNYFKILILTIKKLLQDVLLKNLLIQISL